MIRYLPEQKIVVMDLVDLEHCGFDYRDFEHELAMAGLDENNDALYPIAIMVNVAGGHVLTGNPDADVLHQYQKATQQFDYYVETIQNG